MCVVDFCNHNLHILFMQVLIGGDAGIPRIDASTVVDKIVGQEGRIGQIVHSLDFENLSTTRYWGE